MKYLFALGKFPQISAYEIKSYLLARGIEFTEISEFLTDMPFAIYDIKGAIYPKKMVEELGGTVKIALIISEIDTKRILAAFPQQVKKKGKAAAKRKNAGAKYKTEELESLLKNLPKDFILNRSLPKEVGISLYFWHKSAFDRIAWKDFTSFLGGLLQNIAPTPSIITSSETKYATGPYIIPSESFSRDYAGENAELIVGIGKEKSYFAVVEAIYDIVAEVKRGDALLRPEHWKFGMRARLAKILVNLARAKPGDALLDPFCGIGTVLKEAMLNDIHVVGRDLDGNAAKFANLNMIETANIYGKQVSYNVKQGDARHIELADSSIDAVATEPFLGETLKQRPKQDYANQIINTLRPTYTNTLQEIYRVLKPGKYCAIIAPLISTGRGQVRVDVKKIAQKLGFEVKAPLVEGEKMQIVKREIYVLKKPNGH